MNNKDLPTTNDIGTAPKNTNSNMKNSLTLSLLHVKVEYELLVLCVTLKSACNDIFLLERFQSGKYVNAVAALMTFSTLI